MTLNDSELLVVARSEWPLGSIKLLNVEVELNTANVVEGVIAVTSVSDSK